MFYGINKRNCYKCKEIKSINLFKKDLTKSKGIGYKCKDCASKDSREYLLKNPEYFKEYRKNNRDKYNEGIKKWENNNKDKVKAHKLLQYAVKTGKINKVPCQICNETKSEAHHNFYDRPLDVIWLCKNHHGQVRRNGHYIMKSLLTYGTNN